LIFFALFKKPDRKTRQLAEPEREKLAELYQQQAEAVYRYFRTRTGQAGEAEDLTSLVFRKALESWATYLPSQSAAGWLFGIARHVLVDYYRTQGRASQQAGLPLDGVEELESYLPGPEEHLIQAEEAHLIREAIRHLPALQAEVITLKFTAQLSYPEIAEALGRKEPAVRMLLHRGLENLRKTLAEQREREGFSL
jgi:RNA polymerase sigma-70 factor (ECF subfamily)